MNRAYSFLEITCVFTDLFSCSIIRIFCSCPKCATQIYDLIDKSLYALCQEYMQVRKGYLFFYAKLRFP